MILDNGKSNDSIGKYYYCSVYSSGVFGDVLVVILVGRGSSLHHHHCTLHTHFLYFLCCTHHCHAPHTFPSMLSLSVTTPLHTHCISHPTPLPFAFAFLLFPHLCPLPFYYKTFCISSTLHALPFSCSGRQAGSGGGGSVA